MTPAAPMGLALLLFAGIGWGSNWPPMKLVLAELPPMTARSLAMSAAVALLGGVLLAARVPMRVPRGAWGRLWVAALLNITAWMGLAALALLWLDASEACIIAYAMPVLASLLAWPILGERPTSVRVAALAMGMAGVGIVMLGRGVDIGLAKLPGVACALGAAGLFALGTVLTKRRPLPMAGPAAVWWQLALGSVPIVMGMVLFERAELGAVSTQVWALLGYMAVVPLCLCYMAWFAALRRLPASVATIGTLVAPLVGVAGSAAFLGEPFGLREGAALGLTLGGVVLAARG